MATKNLHGTPSAKVENSWRLEVIMEQLAETFDPAMAITFNHVRNLRPKPKEQLK